MVMQGFQRNTSSHCSTLDWAKYNDTAFPSKLVSDESQLCNYGQTWFGGFITLVEEAIHDCRIHCFGGRSNLTFTHYGGPQEKWKVAHLHQFLKIKCNHNEGSISFAIYEKGLGYGSWTQSILIFGRIFQLFQIPITPKDQYKTTFKWDIFLWLVMPFKSKNVPPTCQWVISMALKEYLGMFMKFFGWFYHL